MDGFPVRRAEREHVLYNRGRGCLPKGVLCFNTDVDCSFMAWKEGHMILKPDATTI